MSSRYKLELGQAIKRRRSELGLTQKDLADLTHFKEGQTVSRWERGENLPSDLEIVANALQWTLAEMMADIAPPDRRTARRLGIVDNVTPDPFSSNGTVETRLDAIEQKLEDIRVSQLALLAAIQELRKAQQRRPTSRRSQAR
jgi:transcriptional regulator with XRE-family HTH domain